MMIGDDDCGRRVVDWWFRSFMNGKSDSEGISGKEKNRYVAVSRSNIKNDLNDEETIAVVF